MTEYQVLMIIAVCFGITCTIAGISELYDYILRRVKRNDKETTK